MALREYWAVLRRWLWLIVFGTILAAGGAYVVSRNMEPIYESTVTLRIDVSTGAVNNQYAGLLAAEQMIGTYSQQMKMRPVMETTLAELGLQNWLSATELANTITVAPVRDTQLIQLSVEGPDPELVARIANKVAEVFIDQNREFEQSRYSGSKEALARELAQVQQDLEATQLLIDDLGTPVILEGQIELERLSLTLSTQRATYSNLLSSYEELRIAEASQSSVLIVAEEAIPSYISIRPQVMNNTVLAALVGAMLAAAIVLLVEYLDDSVKTPDEVTALTNAATLGVIGQIEGATGREKLVTMNAPRSPLSEAFRALRTNIQFSAVDEPLKSILVTSSGPGEGKSTTAANLATVIAQAGKNVILVDADLRRPTLHRFFELPNGQGLTTALLDVQSPAVAHLQETIVPRLKVMSSGPIPPNPAELLNSQRQSDLIVELVNSVDVVIIDSPPVLTVADALVLAPQVSGVLLVVEAGRTRREMLQKAKDALVRTEGRLLGVALNRLTSRRSGYYYQYYQYYFNEYEKDSAGQKRQRKLFSGWRR